MVLLDTIEATDVRALLSGINLVATTGFKTPAATIVIDSLTSKQEPTGMPRLSGLQKDVLNLYRNCLRAARMKPVETRPHFEAFARKRFEENLHLDKKDFGTIEFLLRKGRRQLETYEGPNITDIAG